MHSVSTGSTSNLGFESTPPDSMNDVGGSHFSVTAMNAISNVPVTNSGKAISAKEVTEMAWSIGLSRLIPDTIPRVSDTGSSTSSAASASTSDLPARADMNDV